MLTALNTIYLLRGSQIDHSEMNLFIANNFLNMLLTLQALKCISLTEDTSLVEKKSKIPVSQIIRGPPLFNHLNLNFKVHINLYIFQRWIGKKTMKSDSRKVQQNSL